jgi:peptidyl-dipeptidase Dcp
LAAAAAIAVGAANGQATTPAFGPDNPFYAPSTLPFHAPAFDKIKDGD